MTCLCRLVLSAVRLGGQTETSASLTALRLALGKVSLLLHRGFGFRL